MINSRYLSSGFGRILLTGVLVLFVGGVAPAQNSDTPPAEAEEPASEMVEAMVVLASKAEHESTDPRLKEVAPILKAHFGQQFNVFRLHSSPRARVNEADKDGVRMPLVSNYFLRAVLQGVRKDDEQGELVQLQIRLTQLVKGKDDEKPKEVNILGPMKLSFPRDKYFPIGGPAVGKETMILFLRVVK